MKHLCGCGEEGVENRPTFTKSKIIKFKIAAELVPSGCPSVAVRFSA